MYEPLVYGHASDTRGVACHPTQHAQFATACESGHVCLWTGDRRQLIAKCRLGGGVAARCLAFDPAGAVLAVGCGDGGLVIVRVDCGSAPPLSEQLCRQRNAAEAVSAVRFSPDGRRLVTGSHDNGIDIYGCSEGYPLLRRCQGHSSYITHLDWSADSTLFQSNCGAYEALVWDAKTGRQARGNARDVRWAEWTCALGFPVMGVFPDNANGTDVDSVCRSFVAADAARAAAPAAHDPLASSAGRYVVTGDDSGNVRLYAYPCVVDAAPCRTYTAHCSHVKGVRFSYDNRCASPPCLTF